MERAGIQRKVAMAITGHKTERVYRRYDIVSPHDLKIAAAKMEQHLASLGAPLGIPTEEGRQTRGATQANVLN